MVKRQRARRRNTSRAAGMRASLRRLHQAVALTATASRLPADPPPIRSYRTFSIVSEFAIRVGDGSKEEIIFNMLPSDHTIDCTFKAGTPADFSITYADLLNAFSAAIGYKGTMESKDWEVALAKAAIWGPIPQTLATSVELYADSGEANKCLVDHGSPMARPRTGIGFPKLNWGSNKAKVQFRIVAHVSPGLNKGAIIGVLQLSLMGRRCGAPA